jgi:hypothetical protein
VALEIACYFSGAKSASRGRRQRTVLLRICGCRLNEGDSGRRTPRMQRHERRAVTLITSRDKTVPVTVQTRVAASSQHAFKVNVPI